MAPIPADNIFNCIFLNGNDVDVLAPNKRQAITWTNDDQVHSLV